MKFEKTTSKRLKKRLAAKKVRGLALDIDDTLSYTDRHYFKIMAEFANPEKLSVEEIVAKYKNFRRVPYWQTGKAQRLVKTLLGSSDFHAVIPLIRESSKFVKKINAILPIVVYITGRPASAYPGTKRWLQRYGFPNAPIILNSVRGDHSLRHSWKATVLQFLYPHVIGIIDDHPRLRRELREIKYKGTLFLYDSGKNTKRYHHRTKRFTKWQDILKEIEQTLSRGC